MKTNLLKAATVLTVLAAGCLQAQQLSSAVKADVPFAFRAGNTVMPAGVYTVTQYTPGVILIRGEVGRHANAFIPTRSCERRKTQDPMLVFNRYGDRYFLSQVWADGAQGRELPKAPVEHELARAGAIQIATVRAHLR